MSIRQAAPKIAYDDLGALLMDWQIHLEALRRQPAQSASYLTVGRTFQAFLVARGMPPESQRSPESMWSISWPICIRGLPQPRRSAKHYRSLQQLFKFLAEDGEISSNPMERMRLSARLAYLLGKDGCGRTVPFGVRQQRRCAYT